MIHKKILLSVSLIALLNPLNTYPFLLEFLRDIAIVTTTLDEMNRQNRAILKQAIEDSLEMPVDQSNRYTDNTNTPAPTFFEQITRKNTKDKSESIDAEELAAIFPPEIDEIIQFLENNQKFAEMGAVMPKGVLLVGPPGTGKTSIARMIAKKANASFFDAAGSQFIELYVGTGPARIRELFDKARASLRKGYKASIIFIDEIDAIGGKRNNNDIGEYRNTLNELLNQMDGFNQDNRVIVIAATNTADSLDPALKRPGRFDRIVTIGLPDLQARIKILELYAARIKTNSALPLDLVNIAENTQRYSPAELKNLINEAAIRAARNQADFVEQKHVEQALKDLQLRKRI